MQTCNMTDLMPLAELDAHIIEMFRNDGVFEELHSGHFEQKEKENVGLLACPDGRHFLRRTVKFTDMYKGEAANITPVGDFGGTLALDENSPLVIEVPSIDKLMIWRIKKIVRGGYRSLLFLNHAPCAAANEFKKNALDLASSLANAKAKVKYILEKANMPKVTIPLTFLTTDMDKAQIDRMSKSNFFKREKLYRKEVEILKKRYSISE